MIRKILAIALVMILAVTISAPRAAATGVEGVALGAAEMAGVVALIAGSLGIVFTGAGDMRDACDAFVRGLDPNSAAYLALASAVAQGSTIYIAGTNAVAYLGGLVDSVRSFFLPGDSVVVEGSGVSITNLGQISDGYGILSDSDTTTTRFNVLSSPVEFTDSNGDTVGSISLSIQSVTDRNGIYGPFTDTQYAVSSYTLTYGSRDAVSLGRNFTNYGSSYVYFGMYNGHIVPVYVGWTYQGVQSAIVLGDSYLYFPKIDLVANVSGGGETAIDVPVYQEPGAFAPDLVGGIWDRLAQDAASQNGNVIIDTNVGTYEGGATGYVDGDPNGAIAAPQAPSLGGIGSTRTETDASTGVTSQTQTISGTQAVPQSTTINPALTDVQAETSLNGVTLTLTEIFPFCIPFDIYFMLKGLSVPREAPSFEIPLQLGTWLNFSHTFEFEQFESYAQVVRSGELAVFVVGLAAATRKFIKW